MKFTPGSTDFSVGKTDSQIELTILNKKIIFEPSICYEAIFQTSHKKESQFLVNITNDGWFGKTVGPKQHLSAQIFRAVEKSNPLIRSANSGISVVTDENGKLRFHFFFDAGLNTGITYTNKVKTQDIINRITGNKDIEIKNSDESSTAKFQLTIAINEKTNPTKVHDRRTPKPKLKKCIINERVKTSHNGGVHGSPTYGYRNRTVYREKCPARKTCYGVRHSQHYC